MESVADTAMCCPNPASWKDQWPIAGNDSVSDWSILRRHALSRMSIVAVWWQWGMISWPLGTNLVGHLASSSSHWVQAKLILDLHHSWTYSFAHSCFLSLPSPRVDFNQGHSLINVLHVKFYHRAVLENLTFSRILKIKANQTWI